MKLVSNCTKLSYQNFEDYGRLKNTQELGIMSQVCAHLSGFGGLVVSMLASGTRVRTRPKPLDFSGVRIILSRPSFGGEVKESVPCPGFAPLEMNEGTHLGVRVQSAFGWSAEKAPLSNL